MASAQHLTEIKKFVSTILEFKDKDMTSRAPWGTITFESAQRDINEALSIADNLNALPIEYLTDSVADQIQGALKPVSETLKQIDKFDLNQGGDLKAQRDSLVNQLHGHIQQLANPAYQQIPYLLYKQGDVTQNIANLQGAIQKAEKLYGDGQLWVEEKRAEIEGTLEAARDAAAAGGAAVFSASFKSDSDACNGQAVKWLLATGFLAASTLFSALVFWFRAVPSDNTVIAIQHITTKLIFLGVLFGATAWCAGTYRALKHQAAVSRHRGLSIQTLEAFRAAAVDPQVKDAVVLEATRAVFGPSATGYIGADSANDGRINVLELTKSISKVT